MIKYGLFLKPGIQTIEFLNRQKENYKKINKKQNFIDDQPHLTLFHGKFKNKEEALSKFNQVLVDDLPILSFRFVGPHIFFNDHSPGFNTLVYTINPDKNLLTLQKELLDIFNPFKPSNFFNLDKKYLLNIKKYNYPFLGLDFIPHFTITNIEIKKDSSLIKEFLNQNVQLNDYFESIFLAEISDGLEIISEKKYAL
tara:strand:- start:22 stop:612 length:591 start_codon:yes stop_codon:yes gene_type:complete